MLYHHLKFVFRSFSKTKSAFLINLLGLSAGLLSSFLIFLWVMDELHFDKFHTDDHLIFRAMEHQRYANGDVMTTWSTPGILAAELKKEIPEIEKASTSSWPMNNLLTVGDVNQRFDGFWVDADFLDIFSFELINGNKERLLVDPNAILITEDLSEVLFGEGVNAIGESIQINKDEVYKVTGIVKSAPSNSSIQFDYLVNAEKWRDDNEWLKDWGSNGPRTFVKLVEGSDYESVNEKIAGFIKERNEGSVVELFLYPFSRAYLYGSFENAVQTGGRIEYVRMFSIIAIFVLFIACINFMNLSTAKASRKAKDVGIRKALGAYRNNLISQYLLESFSLSLLAVLTAICLIPIILPYFNEIVGKDLVFTFNMETVLIILSVLLVTGFLAGSYPALYLSSFQPVKVLKNEIKSSFGEVWARRGLVIFQFALSIFLIIAVAVVYSQISFVQNQNLGYKKDNLIFFNLEGKLPNGGQESFLNEVRKIPGVINASASGHNFTGRNNNTAGLWWPEKMEDESVLFENFRGTHELISTMGIEFKEGRDFSKEMITDSSAIIFNETAIELMRIEDPIGKKIKLWGDERRIIGVTKDFHYQSLHSEVSPAFFILGQYLWMGQIRIKGDNTQETLAAIDELHTEFNPGFDFDYTFQDENYERMYRSEKRVASISQYFAGIAILISCLGLLGLAAFTAERRIKEIGIRKVLGASVLSLIILLSKEFSRLVIIAIVIAIPVAWYAANSWLSDFAFHIELGILYFLFAGLIALVVAVLTVSSQAYGAANVNPVDVLKDE